MKDRVIKDNILEKLEDTKGVTKTRKSKKKNNTMAKRNK